MQEVLQMLQGKSWASIQELRKQREEFLKAACVLGGLVFVGVGLSKSFETRS